MEILRVHVAWKNVVVVKIVFRIWIGIIHKTAIAMLILGNELILGNDVNEKIISILVFDCVTVTVIDLYVV